MVDGSMIERLPADSVTAWPEAAGLSACAQWPVMLLRVLLQLLLLYASTHWWHTSLEDARANNTSSDISAGERLVEASEFKGKLYRCSSGR